MTAFYRNSTTWICEGQTVAVHGYRIDCGMFYLGSAYGFSIDDELPVGKPDYRKFFQHNDAPITYRGLGPEGRGAFLEWLQNRRVCPREIPNQFLRLLLQGFEYRLIADGDTGCELPAELIKIVQEYENQAFTIPYLKFLHAWGWLDGSLRHCPLFAEILPDILPPKLIRCDLSDLQLLAASLSKSRHPLTADLGYLFALYHPRRHPRTNEFHRNTEAKMAFFRRFAQRFPNGLQLNASNSVAHYIYRPTENHLCETGFLDWEIPNIWDANFAFIEVREIWNQVVDDVVAPTLPWTKKPPPSDPKKEKLLRENTEATHAFLTARLSETEVSCAPLNRPKVGPIRTNSLGGSESTMRPQNLGSVARELSEKPEWPWSEFEAVAKRRSLLPWALYQSLNEWSVDQFEDFLLTGKETIQINGQLINQICSNK